MPTGACTQRVSEWFVSTLERDGTIRGELDLIAYYHAPNLLAACDRAGEAQRMVNWLAENALADDGDFRYQNKKGDIIQPSMQWNYINGWLTWGLARLGRFDVSEPAARFLERFQDESTGGFLTAANPDDGYAPVTGAVDVGSTCAATLGMIYSGRWMPPSERARFFFAFSTLRDGRTRSTAASVRKEAQSPSFPTSKPT